MEVLVGGEELMEAEGGFVKLLGYYLQGMDGSCTDRENESSNGQIMCHVRQTTIDAYG